MTSLRKIQANRANARTSTGPKRAQSKARTARNARRHGLSLSVFADPVLSEQVEAIAREIAGGPTDINPITLLAASRKRRSIGSGCAKRAINSWPIL